MADKTYRVSITKTYYVEETHEVKAANAEAARSKAKKMDDEDEWFENPDDLWPQDRLFRVEEG